MGTCRQIPSKILLIRVYTLPSLHAQTCFSEGSWHHLSAEVRSRMILLCNEFCPRGADGVMIMGRFLGAQKRPPWCVAKVIHEVEREFDASQLVGVKKTIRYIAMNT